MSRYNSRRIQSGQALTEGLLILGALVAFPVFLSLVSATLERKLSDEASVLNLRMQGLFADNTVKNKDDWQKKKASLPSIANGAVDFSLNAGFKKRLFPGSPSQAPLRTEVRGASGDRAGKATCSPDYEVQQEKKGGKYSFSTCASVTGYHPSQLNRQTEADMAQFSEFRSAKTIEMSEAAISPLFAGDFFHNPHWPWRSHPIRSGNQLASLRLQALLPYQKPDWKAGKFWVRDCLFNYPAQHTRCTAPPATGSLYTLLTQTLIETTAAQTALCLAELHRNPQQPDCKFTKAAVKSGYAGVKTITDLINASTTANETKLRLELSKGHY